MSSKRILGVLSLIVLSVPVMPAGAQTQTSCKGQYVVTLSPGIGSEPVEHGEFGSGGETGTITCDDGRTGTLGVDGRYGTGGPTSCTSGGEGWGVFSYTIDGKTMKDTFTMDFGGVEQGFISGRFTGKRLAGTFTFTPTTGNCATEPATRGDVRVDGVLKG